MNLNRFARVLVLREGELWVAQCLEYDIACQADSFADLREVFIQQFICQVEADVADGHAPFQHIPPAPQEYQDMWPLAWEFVDKLSLFEAGSAEHNLPPHAIMALIDHND